MCRAYMQMPEKMILGTIESLLLNAIHALKDEDYQRRIWFRAEGPEVDSYNDTCTFLMESCEYIFKNAVSKTFLGNANYSMITKLYDLVHEHYGLVEDSTKGNTDLLQENDLLDDPNWHDIQSLAQEAYDKLTAFVERKNNESPN